VTPQNQTLGAGSTLQFAATANYSFGPPQNITSSVTWSSANTGVATVSGGGVVTCVAGANSAVTITATSGSISGSTAVTCQAPTLKYIFVTSQWSGEIPNGGTRQLTATATYSFGPPQNVTGKAAWSSSATSVATVSAGGLVSCKRRTSYYDGLATISATIGSTTGWIYIVCDGLGS